MDKELHELINWLGSTPMPSYQERSIVCVHSEKEEEI